MRVFFGGKTKSPLAEKTNKKYLPKPFAWSYENRSNNKKPNQAKPQKKQTNKQQQQQQQK